MAVLLAAAPGFLAEEALPHKTWTREELALVESTGLFDGTHYELIEGELIDKMGKKRKHVRGTNYAAKALEAIFGADYVDREAPIDVAHQDSPRNEPEPDVIVLRRHADEIEDANPGPADLVLVLEVADTTLRQELTTKAELYARAGIPEYWVLDLKGHRLHVFRDPSSGVYRSAAVLDERESVSPLEKPSESIAVASLLPGKRS